jgi:hypothetical protein
MSTQAPQVSHLTSVHLAGSEPSAPPFGVERPLTCDEASQLFSFP